jgi:hypothetical protein
VGHVLADQLGVHCFAGDAHALLMAIYKDKRLPIELRADAAAKALPYEKPRLQALAIRGSDKPVEVRHSMSDELAEIFGEAAKLAMKD